MANSKFMFRLALFTTLLAAFVVILGAYTRLSDSGLGCPDWPGCYGNLTVPTTQSQITRADKLYPATPVEEAKAWTEMAHRYVAGSLGIFILLIALISLFKGNKLRVPTLLPLLILAFTAFQVVLGMWTVTLKLLPTVVMGHLMGGMTILALLWLYTLRAGNPDIRVPAHWRKLRPFAMIGLLIVIGQIFLGGWVSANYAALICPNFPFCHGSLFPHLNLAKGFDFYAPIGANYMGGNMDAGARVTIQMIHRYGAMITTAYWGLFSLWLIVSSKTSGLRLIGLAVLAVLAAQVTLGVLNVVWLLPLPIAVAHNGFAAILLLAVIALNFNVYSKGIPSFRGNK